MTFLIGFVFFAWFVLSMLGQFSGDFVTKFRRFDMVSLIPRWTFFAPNPGTSDYHLLYRNRYQDGAFSQFKDVPLRSSRSLIHTLWNPHKINQKVLSDVVQILPQMAKDVKPQGLKTTIPYLATLNHIASLDHPPISNAIQFIIMQSFGYYTEKDPMVIVVSEIHALHNL